MSLSLQAIPQIRPVQPLASEVAPPQKISRPSTTQITTQAKAIQEKPKTSASSFDYLDVSKMTIDALLRGIFRFAETFITNPVTRIGFRAVSETTRKSAELIGFKALRGEEVTKADWTKTAVRILENTAGSAVFEPNQYTNRLVRVGVGLANMVVRFATRAGLYAVKVIDTGALGLDHVTDELFGRSVLRAIFADTNNPVIGIGTRFLEQLGINATVHVQPIKNYLSKKIGLVSDTVPIVESNKNIPVELPA